MDSLVRIRCAVCRLPELLELTDRHGWRQQVALHFDLAKVAQGLKLFRGFHTNGDDSELKPLADTGDLGHQVGAGRVAVHLVDEHLDVRLLVNVVGHVKVGLPDSVGEVPAQLGPVQVVYGQGIVRQVHGELACHVDVESAHVKDNDQQRHVPEELQEFFLHQDQCASHFSPASS